MSGSDRWVIAIGAGVLAIVLIASVVVLAAGEPDITDYAPDTPEGTLQRYLRAVYAGDDDAALALSSARVNEQIDRDGSPDWFHCRPAEGQQVRLQDVDLGDQRATIWLEVVNINGSALGFDRYTWDRSVMLVFEDDGWKVDEPYFCI